MQMGFNFTKNIETIYIFHLIAELHSVTLKKILTKFFWSKSEVLFFLHWQSDVFPNSRKIANKNQANWVIRCFHEKLRKVDGKL